MRSLFDSSVLITAVVDQLASHESAFDALRRHGIGDHWGCCSTHALAECYATLTALPLASRVLPEQARLLVEESIAGPACAVRAESGSRSDTHLQPDRLRAVATRRHPGHCAVGASRRTRRRSVRLIELPSPTRSRPHSCRSQQHPLRAPVVAERTGGGLRPTASGAHP